MKIDLNFELTPIQLLEGHGGMVWQANWNSEGTKIVSCSGDKTIRVWECKKVGESMECKNTHVVKNSHSRSIRSAVFEENNKQGNERIAAASFDGTISIHQYSELSDSYKCVCTLEGHENEVKSVSWCKDKIASCGRDKSVWIWQNILDNDEDDEFECIGVYIEHEQDVKSVKWNKKYNILASASYDDSIRIWRGANQPNNGEYYEEEEEEEDEWYCSQVLNGHESTVWDIDFDGSGKYMVSCSDDLTIRIWEYSNGANGEFPGAEWKWNCVYKGGKEVHKRAIYSVSWSKNNINENETNGDMGYIATCGGDNTIRIFKVTSNLSQENKREIKVDLVIEKKNAHGHYDLNSISWNPKDNGYLTTAGDDKLVKVWKFTTC